MSTSQAPVGPLPQKVYWRRRLIAGLGLVAVILAIVLILVRPGQGAPPSDPPHGSPVGSASSEPDSPAAEEEPPTAADGSPGACTAASVTLEAITDKRTYAVDERPQLSLTVTNTGAHPCTLQAGSDLQEYRITSGTDVIWSSKHCQEDPQPAETVLDPDESVSTTPLEWARERSTPDTCEGEREAVVGGGASYHLEVVVGELESAQTKQFILL
jgi:hypothetical protein